MQILHPNRNLMNHNQRIHAPPLCLSVPIPVGAIGSIPLQIRNKRPILHIRTNEKPRRLARRATRSINLEQIRVIESGPDLDFVKE
jgi:hypothetical protein